MTCAYCGALVCAQVPIVDTSAVADLYAHAVSCQRRPERAPRLDKDALGTLLESFHIEQAASDDSAHAPGTRPTARRGKMTLTTEERSVLECFELLAPAGSIVPPPQRLDWIAQKAPALAAVPADRALLVLYELHRKGLVDSRDAALNSDCLCWLSTLGLRELGYPV